MSKVKVHKYDMEFENERKGFTVTDAIWFSSLVFVNGQMGIVMGITDDGQKKAYIGVGGGENEEKNIQLISDWGGPLPPSVGDMIVDHFKQQEQDDEK